MNQSKAAKQMKAPTARAAARGLLGWPQYHQRPRALPSLPAATRTLQTTPKLTSPETWSYPDRGTGSTLLIFSKTVSDQWSHLTFHL